MSIQNELEYIKLLSKVIDAYEAAAKKFIDKVDSGQARSRETYADLKACREMAQQLSEAPK